MRSRRMLLVALLAIAVCFVGVIAASFSRATIVRACPTYEQTCLKKYVDSLLETRGLPEASRAVRDLYGLRPEFRPECHTFMLLTGVRAAQRFPDPNTLSVTPETEVCNYGFYQQYPASLIMNGASLDKVRSFCERVGSEIGSQMPDAEAECYRGIGRGLPFTQELLGADAKVISSSAIAQCKTLASTKDEYMNCVSGAFSEIARKSVRNERGLSVRKDDPMWLCRLQKGDEEQACMGNWKWTLAATFSDPEQIRSGQETSALHGGYDKYVALYGQKLDASAEQMLWTLGYEQARHDVAQPTEAVLKLAAADCEALPGALRDRCAEGYSVGLAKHGDPWNQHKLLFRFCEVLRDTSIDPTSCLRGSIPYLQGFYAPTQRQSLCDEADSLYGYTCVASD